MTKPIRDTTMIAVRFRDLADGDGAVARGIGAANGVTTGACMAARTAAISFGMKRVISPSLASSLRISRKEGQRFTACRSMVSRHVGPVLMKQDVLNFLSETNIRQ
jgi:hypothetical protein